SRLAAVHASISRHKRWDGAATGAWNPWKPVDCAPTLKRSHRLRDYAPDGRHGHVPRLALWQRNDGCRGTPHEVGLYESHVRAGGTRALRASLSSKHISTLRTRVFLQQTGTRNCVRHGVLCVGFATLVSARPLSMGMGSAVMAQGIRHGLYAICELHVPR